MRKNLSIITILIVLLSTSVWAGNFSVAAKPVKPENGVFTFPASEFAGGVAKHFEFQSAPGQSLRFFVVQSKDGKIRAALDACEVCYRAQKGYVQKGNDMICVNCGQKFKTEKVGEVKGGCNPHPVKVSVEGDKVVISAQEILSGSRYFQ
jgi:uncharacterized membrane protein